MSTITDEAAALLPCDLEAMFEYRADGSLIWTCLHSMNNGKIAGSKDSKGRIRIEIGGKSYSAHHIVWAMHHGAWPKNQIDHVNQIKADNRIENLREATNAENSRNRKSKNRIAKGVSKHKGRYIARIMVDGKVINLGSYDRADFAAHAYQIASLQYHEEFACPTN